MYQPKFPEFWVDWKAPYTSGLDDVWACCNAGFLLHGDTNFRFICNCFFSVALRYLLFRLECFNLDDIAFTYSEMFVLYYRFWFVNK